MTECRLLSLRSIMLPRVGEAAWSADYVNSPVWINHVVQLAGSEMRMEV